MLINGRESLGRTNFHHMPYEVFYENTDYQNYKVCNFEGEDNTCSNKYLTDLDLGIVC